MFRLTPEIVDAIHDEVLSAHELGGRALDKSLEGAMARVENRLVYGMVADVYDLAALYAVVIATGHCFNDGNKRTAYRSMEVCLEGNGVSPVWEAVEVGDLIIRVAQRLVDEDELAGWLRRQIGG